MILFFGKYKEKWANIIIINSMTMMIIIMTILTMLAKLENIHRLVFGGVVRTLITVIYGEPNKMSSQAPCLKKKTPGEKATVGKTEACIRKHVLYNIEKNIS